MTKKNTRFVVIWAIVAVVTLALAIGVNLMVTIFEQTFSSVLGWGVGETEVIKAEGTEDWDTDYYSPSFKSLEEAAANGAKNVEKICDEGFVLLKNDDGTLPLSTSNDTIALMGRGSVDAVYGGSGSGNVDLTRCATAVSGLRNAGFTVDETVNRFFSDNYTNYDRCQIVMDDYDGSTFFIGEVPVSAYTFTPNSAHTAVVFITRGGGEGWDLSTDLVRDSKTTASQSAINRNANTKREVDNYVSGQHQLELSKEEKDMIAYAKANYAKTVVVINSSNIIEANLLESGEYSADAVVWVGGPGESGFNSLGKILSGAVNPSGRTVDTWAADFTKDPTFSNTGVFEYEGITSADVADGGASNVSAYFTQCEEGIYVGYRYYETASEEGYINYDNAVVYPFGHGLSYTTFEKTITDFSDAGDNITVSVRVTNTGDVAGKETVQLYYTPPYNEGGIEKSSVNLMTFGKTKMLAPDESDTLSFNVPKEELASYDYKGIKAEGGGYVLEAGTYTISLRENSHDVIESRTFNQGGDIVYGDTNKRDSDEITATNRFDDISQMFQDTATDGYATNMSRADFAGTFPTAPTTQNHDFDPTYITLDTPQQNGGTTIKAGLAVFNVNTDPTLGNVSTSKIYASDKPTTDATSGLNLIDLRSKSFEDPAWELLLNQLKTGDLSSGTLNASAYNTAEIKSIGKPATVDPDGPQGISSLFGKTGCCGYMSEVVTASSWNVEMARVMGVSVGEEALCYGSSGWYAPAANMHRNPFGGRNFEYYSEDGLLSGMMAQASIEGAAEKGVYSYLKHYALNDTEVKRVDNNCTWANEQAIREIYLRPFEVALKRATMRIKYITDDQGTVDYKDMRAATALMSSFNRIGTTWAGGHYGLMTEVLRDEWGFDGVVISDFNLYQYMSADQGMRAGTDLQLSFSGYADFTDTTSATAMNAIRKSIHRMSYAVVNSNKMQGAAPGATFIYHMPAWQKWFVALDVLLYTVSAISIVLIIIRLVRSKRNLD
ncbi:MAG: glycoside hydrolase family 3 protein [Clostridia bacterium]|nr:glycoside hydrolase family 3 protein [Clostridia bacterium]